MPIYLYWGEDDFALEQAVTKLRKSVLDPQWASFNYDKISPEQPDAAIQALNLAMTPTFGAGRRLVWLVDPTLFQHCSEDLLAELERTLPVIPESSVLLITSRNKPDGRLKSTKLVQKYADSREFSPIPPWKTDQIGQQVREAAQEVGVKLTEDAIELLAESVGNDTRLLFGELKKLQMFGAGVEQPLNADTIAGLVTANTQNSLKLVAAIRSGDAAKALGLVADLINRNEPALRIVATAIGLFRTWLWVRLMMDAGVRDEKAIAAAAEVSNPKRIHFLQQEVRSVSLQKLSETLPVLLDLEVSLKQGAEPTAALQTAVVQLCHICK
ncbi:DNA polymerase III subunit delta [Planktothrix sp. FACHB-1355]|uniref:DNA polymerase III subunit delta n=1 Tax=Aerosakkonema funiforme FACHB-1375 TaxID=2949571 RepID=A0A926VFV5_9CYAN|nr:MULTISPECIES: DNA polymerase III subunit delta [Oscillatoriales]MBD2183046.1 DNA polymerase III subunit delta [Aerosakkonema funiforme FACHB-1375]MBD3557770.1 DNA polymerase III subunit delta [Planktothrix sp. FACHB-1355]